MTHIYKEMIHYHNCNNCDKLFPCDLEGISYVCRRFLCPECQKRINQSML